MSIQATYPPGTRKPFVTLNDILSAQGAPKPLAMKRFSSDTPEAAAQKSRILAMTADERRAIGIFDVVAVSYPGTPVGAKGPAKLAAQHVAFIYDPEKFSLDIRV